MRFVSRIAALEGVARVPRGFPEVPLFTAVRDSKRKARAGRVPGWIETGDPLFGV